jgi:hypothetical protein
MKKYIAGYFARMPMSRVGTAACGGGGPNAFIESFWDSHTPHSPDHPIIGWLLRKVDQGLIIPHQC